METMHAAESAVVATEDRATQALVATDGKAQSDGALLAGSALQSADAPLTIVAVLPPIPVVSPEVPVLIDAETEARRAAEVRTAVESQADRVLGNEVDWHVDIRRGDPASIIVEAAREGEANLVITGLGRHRIADRVFGDETALRLIRLGSLPVLAVPPTFDRAPRRIVVAMDFSPSSVRAARLALDLASESATVHLVHVSPRETGASLWAGGDWLAAYHADAEAELVRAAERLNVSPDVTVDRAVLHGDVASQLLAFATKVNADLIAVGSHGHGFIARMLIGSVATKVLRGSSCAVLVTPCRAPEHRGQARKSRAAAAQVTALPKPEWSRRLDDFTRRNIGRRGVLEVDDPELGAQAQEHDYPLLGATYDPNDRRVELMLGDLGSVERHLTRGIGDVRSIDVLTTADGRDVALRIAHGAGQSLLTFTR